MNSLDINLKNRNSFYIAQHHAYLPRLSIANYSSFDTFYIVQNVFHLL